MIETYKTKKTFNRVIEPRTITFRLDLDFDLDLFFLAAGLPTDHQENCRLYSAPFGKEGMIYICAYYVPRYDIKTWLSWLASAEFLRCGVSHVILPCDTMIGLYLGIPNRPANGLAIFFL